MEIQVGIISVSDRATKGVYDDAGGPALKGAASNYGWAVIAESVVPDEILDLPDPSPSKDLTNLLISINSSLLQLVLYLERLVAPYLLLGLKV